MVNAVVYTTRVCAYCSAAKRLLNLVGVGFREVDLSSDPELREAVMKKAGQRTVPQIWIGRHHIGGFDELNKLHRSGALAQLLVEAGENQSPGHLSEITEEHS